MRTTINLDDHILSEAQRLTGLTGRTVVVHVDLRALIERHELMGRGLGYIDIHLLAATRLTEDARLWTRDRRLAATAKDLGIGYNEKLPLEKR